MIELGARLTRCEHFRWLPGMAVVRRKHGPAGGAGLYPTQLRVAVIGGYPCDPHAGIVDVDDLPRTVPDDPHWVPDLTDPATVGCLLALVRDARGAVIVRPPDDPPQVTGWWEVEALPDGPAWGGWTEAEALVAALEEA